MENKYNAPVTLAEAKEMIAPLNPNSKECPHMDKLIAYNRLERFIEILFSE